MWWIALAIAVPFLFVIGTTYSAIKEQKKLERGALKEVLSERQKKRLEHYSLKSQYKKGTAKEQEPLDDSIRSVTAPKEVSAHKEAVNQDLSPDRLEAIAKVDALLDKLDNMHDDGDVTLSADGGGQDAKKSDDIYALDTSAKSIQKSLDEALLFVEDDGRK